MEVINQTQVVRVGAGGDLRGLQRADPEAAAQKVGPEITTVAKTAGHTYKDGSQMR